MNGNNSLGTTDQASMLDIQQIAERLATAHHRMEQISTITTDKHARGIVLLHELGLMRCESDALIRRIAVEMVRGGYMHQKEVSRLTGFSRNTISAWVRKEVESTRLSST